MTCIHCGITIGRYRALDPMVQIAVQSHRALPHRVPVNEAWIDESACCSCHGLMKVWHEPFEEDRIINHLKAIEMSLR